MKYMMIAIFGLATSSALAQAPTVYTGGRVWTGEGFEAQDIAVAGDRIVDSARVGEVRRVSVEGRYLVPAYGNAHAHITPATADGSRTFTDAGVFYVWNPNTIVIDEADRAFYARPDVYDVKVAQGGLTEPGGHPERLYVEFLTQYVYQGKDLAWFLGNAFHYGTTEPEIDAALDLLASQGAQVVKIYLLNSERYAKSRNDPAAYGAKGLNPANVPYLVRAAHARGLPVAAHLETAHDLRVAAEAGVDVAAHLPGYGGDELNALEARRITADLAAIVARSGMKVTPTYALIRGSAYAEGATVPKQDAQAQIDLQRENLRALRDAGVTVLMGTDGIGPIWPEAEHLVHIGALSALEATRITLSTGAKLFPERSVGCLQVGCEADFLVLLADPTRDIAALREIETRIMQGSPLPGPSPIP